MKIYSTADLIVLSANANPSMDGKNTFYNLALMSDGEVGNISCTKDVYDDVSAVLEKRGPLAKVRLGLMNSAGGKYDSFRITSFVQELTASDAVTAGSNKAPADSTAKK